MMRAAVHDAMADGVEARQLQALEFVEQRVDGNLRTREHAIGFGEHAAVGVVDANLTAARTDSICCTFSDERFDAAGNRVQRELARRRSDIDAEYGVTRRQADSSDLARFGLLEDSRDQFLRLGLDPMQVIDAAKALGVYLVNLFGARRTRREPSVLRDHLDSADWRSVARRDCQRF